MAEDIETSAPVAEAPEVSSAVDTAPQSEPQGFSTPYEAFRHVPEFQGQDDLTIARNLYQAYQGFGEAQRHLQQYQQVMPVAQEYLRNKAEYDKWRASQAQAAAPQPAPKPKFWDPPQVKDTWKSYIVRDPSSGKEMIAPDAPMEAQMALREYQAYTADFARKFVTDPENTLKPFVEDLATQKAKELVEQHLNQFQAKNYVQSLEQQNADWLYDQAGQITPEGQAIQTYIEQAKQFGIQSPEARWQFATGMLQRDLLNLRYQQMQSQPMREQPPQAYAPPADPVAQQNMQFLRERATRTPNRSAGTTEPRAPRQKMSFEERLRSQLTEDGVL
jgi:hypothetical protein